MNASELSRKLLYCGYSDVTDYLKRGPVERFLYKRLIEIVPMAEIDVPVVNILNELYYQCARIQYDHTPGTNYQLPEKIGNEYFVVPLGKETSEL